MFCSIELKPEYYPEKFVGIFTCVSEIPLMLPEDDAVYLDIANHVKRKPSFLDFIWYIAEDLHYNGYSHEDDKQFSVLSLIIALMVALEMRDSHIVNYNIMCDMVKYSGYDGFELSNRIKSYFDGFDLSFMDNTDEKGPIIDWKCNRYGLVN